MEGMKLTIIISKAHKYNSTAKQFKWHTDFLTLVEGTVLHLRSDVGLKNSLKLKVEKHVLVLKCPRPAGKLYL